MGNITNDRKNALDQIEARFNQQRREPSKARMPLKHLNAILRAYAREGNLLGEVCFIEDCDRPTFYLRGLPDDGEYLVKLDTWDHPGDNDEQGVRREAHYRLVPVRGIADSKGPALNKHQIVGMRCADQANQFFLWNPTLTRVDVPGQGIEAEVGC